jgi:hypothetical protein
MGSMLGAKIVNQPVVKMYVDNKQPYIETTITIRTPLEGSQIHKNFKMLPEAIQPTLEGMNNGIQDIIGETFEADVVSVYSGVKNLFT